MDVAAERGQRQSYSIESAGGECGIITREGLRAFICKR